ncbi:MAG: type II secretion system F family protein [Rothia sp. (in: high G+C Gram-positive bacteria)]|nr:type II secretion system F family protein [Rothia sp. (in: high G+C Gram-positive bacteria)]
MDTLILAVSVCCLGAGLLLWVRQRRSRQKPSESKGAGCPDSEQLTGEQEDGLDAALYLDLAASMLAAGLPVRTLLEQLGCVDGGRYRKFLQGVVIKMDAGATWLQAWGKAVPAPLAGVHSAVGLSLETGAPSAEFLRVLADRQRRHRQRALEKSAAKLGVKLVVPLGLCSLPAFICLGVVPVLIAMVPSLL